MVATKSRRLRLPALVALLVTGAGLYFCSSLLGYWTVPVGIVMFVVCLYICDGLWRRSEANITLLYKPVPYGGRLVYARTAKQPTDTLFVVPKHRLYSLRTALDAAMTRVKTCDFARAEADACHMLPDLRRTEMRGVEMVQMAYAILWQSCEAAHDDSTAEHAWKRMEELKSLPASVAPSR